VSGFLFSRQCCVSRSIVPLKRLFDHRAHIAFDFAYLEHVNRQLPLPIRIERTLDGCPLDEPQDLMRTPEDTASFDGAASRMGAPVATPSSRANPDCKAQILIVDDDASVREILAELLEDHGYCSIVAPDAAQALSILRRGIAIDALVTDLTMPGDDGIALIRKAREIDNTLPAILLTGYAEQFAPAWSSSSDCW
jgi:PleD family two-component response regulator